jgi:hypothetical protein
MHEQSSRAQANEVQARKCAHPAFCAQEKSHGPRRGSRVEAEVLTSYVAAGGKVLLLPIFGCRDVEGLVGFQGRILSIKHKPPFSGQMEGSQLAPVGSLEGPAVEGAAGLRFLDHQPLEQFLREHRARHVHTSIG